MSAADTVSDWHFVAQLKRAGGRCCFNVVSSLFGLRQPKQFVLSHVQNPKYCPKGSCWGVLVRGHSAEAEEVYSKSLSRCAKEQRIHSSPTLGDLGGVCGSCRVRLIIIFFFFLVWCQQENHRFGHPLILRQTQGPPGLGVIARAIPTWTAPSGLGRCVGDITKGSLSVSKARLKGSRGSSMKYPAPRPALPPSTPPGPPSAPSPLLRAYWQFCSFSHSFRSLRFTLRSAFQYFPFSRSGNCLLT